MKNIFFFKIFVFCAFLSCFLFPSNVNASVNDFVIKDFQAEYYLDRDIEGRSILKTVERIIAEFPSIDQNHGIERAIPIHYDGHTTNLKILSVTDDSGTSLPYTIFDDRNGNSVLRIGDADTYVHGDNIYKITYTQRDVTKYYQDSKADEFYWDVNGLGWSQSFEKVSARLYLGKELQEKLTGNMYCYYGVSGSNNNCNINQGQDYISASVNNLYANENMTIAVGFEPGTFKGYNFSNIEWITFYIVEIMLIFNAISLLIILLIKKIKAKDHPGKGIIVPEYLPPKNINILLSSIIRKDTSKWLGVILMDFAVRHNIKILQESKKIWFFKTKNYKIEYINSDGLYGIENNIIHSFFGNSPKVGDQYDIKKARTDYALSVNIKVIFENVDKESVSLGYFKTEKNLKIILYMIIFVTALITLISGYIFSDDYTNMETDLLFSSFLLPFIYINIVLDIKPLLEKGRDLFDYLEGLKMYIKLAEADRLRVLQSSEGVQKTKVNTSDDVELLHLYERLLPYAILFGLEKKWNKVLGNFYEKLGSQPDWYVGVGSFNAISFASAVSDFSNYVSSSNSSSSGSSGDGSSGGGGGGGGGGGW